MAMNPRIRRHRAPVHRHWSGPRPTASTDPRRARRRPPAPTPPPSEAGTTATLDTILDEFTRSWERGDHPQAEKFLGLLAPADSAELIYHEYCLAEASDLEPDPTEYLRRFPEQADALNRLFSLHGALPASMLRAWAEPADLPSAGDEIGPYSLTRELGRGAFARVFLAEQADLDNRQVVVKVSTRATAEPRLLARARHAHIVEVLRHAVADDGALHLVCMPFLGGATLASVLERRRSIGRAARSGKDLLSDLDRVAAPEYPASGMSRPAREILADISYPKAIAWIVARLAEALDHAHRRGVAHGDLKPSNVLLTAEATPMLFDFNLAVDWHGIGRGEPASDAGGTLAYMAPERLHAIARGPDEVGGRPIDLHRADLYGMGLVLLESLTGRGPEVPRPTGGSPRDSAEALARSRRDLPGPLRGRGRHSIPPTLRSILAKCLAPDPADRYARGVELAQDLDCWREDRPLVFADETREAALARRVRRGRRVLAAGLLSLAASLAVGGFATMIFMGSKRDQASARWSMIPGGSDPDIFPSRLLGNWQDRPGDPAEIAGRLLSWYGVEADPDWRNRADVAWLPEREHAENEAWLDEQVLRLAMALGDRPDSPGDWKRALGLLEQNVARKPLAAFRAEIRSLRSKLGLPDPGPRPADVPRPPRWLDDYLQGVASERLHAREAGEHYGDVLRARPDHFWAHYRAAVVACRIDDYPEAERHIRRCIAQRPDNPALHVHLASLLFKQDRDTARSGRDQSFAEAIAECDNALDLNPDFAEANFTRAVILHTAGQARSVESDVNRFKLLTKSHGPAASLMHRVRIMAHYGSNRVIDVPEVESLTRQALDANRYDGDARATLAHALFMSGRHSEALAEYDRVIAANPDHLKARYQRGLLVRLGDVRASTDVFAALIAHPRFEELLREEPTAIRSFHYVAHDLAEQGRADEAMQLAQQSLALVNRSRALRDEALVSGDMRNRHELAPRGETYYLMARILASAARSDPGQLLQVAEHLERAFQVHPMFRDDWFAKDRKFEGLRGEILDRIREKPVRF
ncbi:protein kinase domain-containing protein [Tundrisphaera lichenicola]|uniref:protein kinase domain-containing protein n=1 Tax=Tundrisphaera lichenicola TaxID=2029860 RepID=UPI003EB852BD